MQNDEVTWAAKEDQNEDRRKPGFIDERSPLPPSRKDTTFWKEASTFKAEEPGFHSKDCHNNIHSNQLVGLHCYGAY